MYNTFIQHRDKVITLEAKVFSQGTIKLPLALRNELDIHDADKVLFIRKGNTWELTTHKNNIFNAQGYLKQLNKDKVSIVDELIQERRSEVAKDRE